MLQACTLGKRNQLDADKSKNQDTSQNSGVPAGPKIPIDPLPGHLNPQERADLEAFYKPSDYYQKEKDFNGRLPQRKRLTGNALELETKNDSETLPQTIELAYTDSSPDALIELLRIQQFENSKSSEELKKLTLNLAKAVSHVQLSIDDSSKYTLNIQLSENNAETNLSFEGSATALKETFTLNSIIINTSEKDAANKEKTEPRYKTIMQCLDKETKNQCTTYQAKLIKTQDNKDITVQIIIRNSFSEFKLGRFTPLEFKSSSLNEISHLFRNTIDGESFPVTRYGKFQSFSVINGVAGFQLHLETNKGDFLSLGGPLITSFGSRFSMSIPLSKNPQLMVKTSILNKKEELKEKSVDLTQSISEALLKYNNGRGHLEIELKGSQADATATESLKLKVKSLPNALVDLTPEL